MHKVASFNGKIIDPNDARIGALSTAALFGRGVFTTIAIYDGKPFIVDKHLRRLRNNSEVVGLRYSEKELNRLEEQLNELIRCCPRSTR
jgi:branched-subunit amino acid aminotransferase/4-amino-4-deoxychorismate lyase